MNVKVIPLTDRIRKESEYMKAMSKGAKGKVNLQEVHDAWYDYRSLWEDEFAEELRSYGSYGEWVKKFQKP
jgi:hypothetical protein